MSETSLWIDLRRFFFCWKNQKFNKSVKIFIFSKSAKMFWTGQKIKILICFTFSHCFLIIFGQPSPAHAVKRPALIWLFIQGDCRHWSSDHLWIRTALETYIGREPSTRFPPGRLEQRKHPCSIYLRLDMLVSILKSPERYLSWYAKTKHEKCRKSAIRQAADDLEYLVDGFRTYNITQNTI